MGEMHTRQGIWNLDPIDQVPGVPDKFLTLRQVLLRWGAPNKTSRPTFPTLQTWAEVRYCMYRGAIKTWALLDDKEIKEIPYWMWKPDQFRTPPAEGKDQIEAVCGLSLTLLIACEKILVGKVEFSNICTVREVAWLMQSVPHLANAFIHEMVVASRETITALEARSGDAPTPSGGGTPPEGHIPRKDATDTEPGPPHLSSPYFSFMVKAAAALNISEKNRRPKKQVMDWLETNWPPNLGRPSEEKVSAMATFLRHPEHEKGGYYRSGQSANGSTDEGFEAPLQPDSGGSPQEKDPPI
jgi:hypothetical protein